MFICRLFCCIYFDLNDIPSETVTQQLQGLQQQLYAMAKERDDTVMQLAQSHEKNTQYATSLANLQMVLEQFQQGD